MRIGIFLPNWVGDVVMATPTIRAFRALAGDDGRLVGIVRPYVADVLAGSTWLDQLIVYDKPRNRFAVASRDVYRALDHAKLDKIILLTNSLRTAWIAWRSGARERVGYKGDARAVLLTKRVEQPYTAEGLSIATIDGYLHLAQAAGCEATSRQLELATTEDDERAADAAWRSLQLPPGERVIVLNSGGAYGAAKSWPAEYFAELARRIIAGGQYSVLVNCGPAEREVARAIVDAANDPRVVTIAGIEQLPVGLTKACVRRSRLLVTTDSGPRYFGIAFGRPVVTLFGPTDPRLTEPYYAAETCLALKLDCQPCMARTCPLGHHRCMRELTVEMVYDAVLQSLSKNVAEHAA